jgi:hypothetical protein
VAVLLWQCFTEANVEFQEKILERSGLGDETGLSDGIVAMKVPPAFQPLCHACSHGGRACI